MGCVHQGCLVGKRNYPDKDRSRTGNLVELTLHGKSANLVDTSSGEAVNEYLFLEGSDVAKIQKSGPVKISVEEAGPLVASLRIESHCSGMLQPVAQSAPGGRCGLD